MAPHVKLFRSLLLIFDEDLKLLTWINCRLIDRISSRFNVDVFLGVEKAGNFFDIVSVFIQGVSKKSTHFGFANISAFKTS